MLGYRPLTGFALYTTWSIVNSDLIIIVAVLLLCLFFNCKITARLGYGGFAGVLLLVPVLNFFVWGALALLESPVEKEVRYLQSELARLQRKSFAEAQQRSDV